MKEIIRDLKFDAKFKLSGHWKSFAIITFVILVVKFSVYGIINIAGMNNVYYRYILRVSFDLIIGGPVLLSLAITSLSDFSCLKYKDKVSINLN